MFLVLGVIVAFLMGMMVVYLSDFWWRMGYSVSKDREKCSPYECGFEPITSARSPYSLRFFFVAILFLVFEVEASLLVCLVLQLDSGFAIWAVLAGNLFLLILILGLFLEMATGSLEWMED